MTWPTTWRWLRWQRAELATVVVCLLVGMVASGAPAMAEVGPTTDPTPGSPTPDSPTPDSSTPADPVSTSAPLRLAASADRLAWLELLTLPTDRQPLLQAIDYSLDYLATAKAVEDYQNYPLADITHRRVQRSLERLHHLVRIAPNDEVFRAALAEDFVLYESIGHDHQGSVTFTGYFEPSFRANPLPTADYRYPLYGRPADLEDWPLPHPTRIALEGIDGLQGHQGPLAGLELVWLADRLEAFLVQVQGSAKLELPDGQVMAVGYAGRTDYPYTSIGRALVEAGELAAEDLSLPNLLAYFEAHPEALDEYLPLNQRFIFFQETAGGAPTGSLSVPVTAGHSIATDKAIFPPGAAAMIQLPLPQPGPQGIWQSQQTTRLVLDQDTGGAIIGSGRVDLFVGSGSDAGELAGRIHTEGRLLYLLLED
jgi:membrane-bound lytic murein transglycosylase A